MATASSDRLCFGNYVLDLGDERLIGPGGPVRIGNKAFRVLETLAQARGRLLTKDELFDEVWAGTVVSESALTSVVKELRRALGDETKDPRFIESVYGRGYRFLAPVSDGGAQPGGPVAFDNPDRSASAPGHPPKRAAAWHRLRPQTLLWRRLGALVPLAGSVAAIVGLVLHDPSPEIPPATGIELGEIARSNDVAETLPNAIRDATLAAFGSNGSVPVALPGSKFPQPLVLTGAIRGAGDQLEVSFNVTSRASGEVIWAMSDKAAAADPNLARGLGSSISYVVRCALNAAATKPDLSERILAMAFESCGPPPGTGTMFQVDLARRMTVEDPDFAPGWAELASSLGQLLYDGKAPDPAGARAEGFAAARKAQILDPTWPYGWYAMSVLIAPERLADRERYIRRAVAARALDCACMNKVLGDFLAATGRGLDAETAYGRALDHDPGAVGLQFFRLREQLTLDPESPRGQAQLTHWDDPVGGAFPIAFLRIQNAIDRHRYADALAVVPAFERASAGRNAGPTRAAVEALASGDPAAKERATQLLLAGIADPGKRGPIDVQLLGALGEDRGALSLAEAIYAVSHDRGLAPLFSRAADGARRLPEFAALARRSGLLRYWRDQHLKPDFCKLAGAPAICATI